MIGGAKVIPIRPDAEPYTPPRAPEHPCPRCDGSSLRPGLCADCTIDDARDGRPLTLDDYCTLVAAIVVAAFMIAMAILCIWEYGRW